MADRGVVSPDAEGTPRQVRFDNQVAAILNDLAGAGYIVKTAAGWTIAPTAPLFAAQLANLIFAGPAAGADAVPTFRALALADLANDLVTYAKLQNVSAASRILGRGSAAGAGDVQELTLGTNIALAGTVINVTATTSGGGGGGLDPQSSIYPPFTPGANDDEFSDGAFTGWTAVNSGANTPTVTETNHVCSVSLPGGHAAAELAAYVKTVTPSVGDYVECVIRGAGLAQNYNVAGVLMADGDTYGAGQQAVFHYSPSELKYVLSDFSGYNTQDVFNGFNAQSIAAAADTHLRLKYSAANTFRGFVSPDGVSWIDVTGPIAITLTPTRIGFYVSTWGGGSPFVWSYRYFKHSA